MNPTPSMDQILLENPCKSCGYEKANLLKLFGNQFAAKCGRCDCFQFSVSRKKGGAK